MKSAILTVYALAIVGAGCQCGNRMTLEGVRSKQDLVQYSQTPEASADFQDGMSLVEAMKGAFPEKDCEQLIAMLFTHGDLEVVSVGGPRYYLLREGNLAIIEELEARGESARISLEQHSHDERLIWRGDNAFDLSVASMCKDLLQKLEARQSAQPGATDNPDTAGLNSRSNFQFGRLRRGV